MPLSGTLTTRLHALAVALACSTCLVAMAPATALQPASSVEAGEPTVGWGFTMSEEQRTRTSFDENPVDCASRHTSQVVAVAQLPAGISYQSGHLERVIYRACVPAFAAALGRSDEARSQTAYDTAWFVPTPQQQAAGARWLRCDLVLRGGSSLRPLPSSLTLDNPLTDTVRRCLTRVDQWTVCSRSHSARATGAVAIDTARYPESPKLVSDALRKCAAEFSAHDQILLFTYGLPSRLLWRFGQRSLTCYKFARG